MKKDKAVTENTVVFNNLINNIQEYNESWEVGGDSWHSRFSKKRYFNEKYRHQNLLSMSYFFYSQL
jgi:hypothetical protein